LSEVTSAGDTTHATDATVRTLQDRVAELERTAQTAEVLHRIATLASTAVDMPEFYAGVHAPSPS
jgi:hypothetical protein